MPHREGELVSRRSQYETLKSAGCEHDARGLDGRVADSADLMFRSLAKNVAGMTGFALRAGARPRSRLQPARRCGRRSTLRMAILAAPCRSQRTQQRRASSRQLGLHRAGSSAGNVTREDAVITGTDGGGVGLLKYGRLANKYSSVALLWASTIYRSGSLGA